MSTPDPELLYKLYDDFAAQALRMSLSVDVYTPLAGGPTSAEAIARACRCDPIGTRALLDVLVSLGLLDRKGDSYALTPTAATFLVHSVKSYAGDYLMAEGGAQFWDGVLAALRTGKPSNQTFPWAQDAWLESYRTSRLTSSREMWRAAGIEPGQRPGLRVLDVACGCAIKSLVLAQDDPAARVTCLDRPDVLDVARNLAERMNVLTRVTFLPGDMHNADLGQAQHDAALIGQITYYLTPAQNADLFRRIAAALAPGGILILDAIMASDPPGEWAGFVTLLTWAISGGTAHSFDDYRGWLEQAGFRRITQRSEKWLSAQKPPDTVHR